MTRFTFERWMQAAAATAVMLASAGCIEPSLNPLFEPLDARTDARLDGAWACDEKGASTWTFTRKDDTDDGK